MKHTEDFDPVVDRSIEDEVVADRKASQTRTVLILFGSHTPVGCKKLKSLVDLSYQLIGGQQIVISNEVPNLKKIGVRLEYEEREPLALLRTSLMSSLQEFANIPFGGLATVCLVKPDLQLTT